MIDTIERQPGSYTAQSVDMCQFVIVCIVGLLVVRTITKSYLHKLLLYQLRKRMEFFGGNPINFDDNRSGAHYRVSKDSDTGEPPLYTLTEVPSHERYALVFTVTEHSFHTMVHEMNEAGKELRIEATITLFRKLSRALDTPYR